MASDNAWQILHPKERNKALGVGIDVVGLTATLLSVVSMVGFVFNYLEGPRPAQLDLKTKIEQLSKKLGDAVSSIDSIEKEVNARKQLVEQLKSDAETAQNLLTLNQKQTEAVAQALRGQLQQNERDDRWSRWTENMVFAVIGLLLSEGYRYVGDRIARRRSAQSAAASNQGSGPG